MSSNSIGLILYSTKNKYMIVDTLNQSGGQEINVGEIITLISRLDGKDLLNFLSSLPQTSAPPTRENLADQMTILFEESIGKYGLCLGTLIGSEIFNYLDDYLNMSHDDFFSSLKATFGEEFIKKIFNETKYADVGDTTVEQLLLSLAPCIAYPMITAHEILTNLVNDTNPDKILLFFTDLLNLQSTEVKIALLERELRELYTFPTMFSAIAFDVYKIIETRTVVKVCDNCNHFFVPINRSDTKYCNYISPQDSSKTCQEYGTYITYLTKTQTDLSTKLYKQVYNSLSNKIKRSPQNTYLVDDLENFKTNAKIWKFKIKSGKANLSDYEEWLRTQKQILQSKLKPPTTE